SSLLARPLEDVFPTDAARALLEAHFTPERFADVVRPIVRGIVFRSVHDLRNDAQPLRRWIPDDAYRTLLDLVAAPGRVQEPWVRAIFRQRAVEEVLSDTLYKALVDFSTLIPRLLQSYMPSALGKLAKLGGLGAGGMGIRMFEEIEKRLE